MTDICTHNKRQYINVQNDIVCFICSVLKDQWIRAKYERREFTGEKNFQLQAYNSGDFHTFVQRAK